MEAIVLDIRNHSHGSSHVEMDMNIEAKQEIARAIRKAHEVRERSWVGNIHGRGTYTMSHDQALEIASDDADVRVLVGLLLAWTDDALGWADQVLAA